MSSRTRSTSTHLAGALVAAAVGAGAAMCFVGSPAGAAPAAKTYTVTFTDNGPSPASLNLTAGDKVTFVNNLTQTGSLTSALLGMELTGLSDADVILSGATSGGAKTIQHGTPLATQAYTTPGTVTYSYQYKYTLLGLLGVPSYQTTPAKSGTLKVAAAPTSAPTTKPSSQPTKQPAPAPTVKQQPTQQHSQAPQGGTGGGSGGGTAQGQTVPGTGTYTYDPQPGSVADGVVPSAGAAGGSGANANPPALGSNPKDQTAAGNLPEVGSGSPQQSLVADKSAHRDGLGLPAVLAVVLLSVVTAALVRTLITQRRTINA